MPPRLGSEYYAWRVLKGRETGYLEEFAPGIDRLNIDWQRATPFVSLRRRTHIIAGTDLAGLVGAFAARAFLRRRRRRAQREHRIVVAHHIGNAIAVVFLQCEMLDRQRGLVVQVDGGDAGVARRHVQLAMLSIVEIEQPDRIDRELQFAAPEAAQQQLFLGRQFNPGGAAEDVGFTLGEQQLLSDISVQRFGIQRQSAGLRHQQRPVRLLNIEARGNDGIGELQAAIAAIRSRLGLGLHAVAGFGETEAEVFVEVAAVGKCDAAGRIDQDIRRRHARGRGRGNQFQAVSESGADLRDIGIAVFGNDLVTSRVTRRRDELEMRAGIDIDGADRHAADAHLQGPGNGIAGLETAAGHGHPRTAVGRAPQRRDGIDT